MQSLKVPLQEFIGAVKDNGNSFIFSVLIFCFHEHSSTFPCTCKPQAYCITYILLPFLTITSVMLLTDPAFRRVWRYTLSKCSCHFGLAILRRVVKAVCVGCLWVVSVLIRADWYVCCCNPNPRDVAQLQCKSKQEVTHPQAITIKEMEINSRMYGLALLLLITAVAALFLPACNIFTNISSRRCCSSGVRVDELFLEVEEDILTKAIKEKQTKVISENLNSHISKGEWKECFNIVEGFIYKKPKVLDKEEKKKQDEGKQQKCAENQESSKTQIGGGDDNAITECTSVNVTGGPASPPDPQSNKSTEDIEMDTLTNKMNE